MTFENPKAQTPSEKEKPPARRTVGDVHVMPEKFFTSDQRSMSKPKKKKPVFLILLIVFFVLIVSFAVAVLLLNRSLNTPPEPIVPQNSNTNSNANTNVNTNASVNVNVNANTNTTSNTNAVKNENSNTNSNANTNTNVSGNGNANMNTNTNRNTNENVNGNLNTNATVPDAKDSDKDGLTDTEEDLYQTGEKLPDSDNDGFLDGEEIENGYSPNGSGTLEKTNLAKTYTNSVYSYSLLYPSAWPASSTDDSESEVIFTSATSEFIEVLVEENPSGLTITDWFLVESSGTEESDLVTRIVDGYKAVVSLDGLNVYIGVGDSIYTISYNVGLRKEASFRATFEMMIQSFAVKEKDAGV
ncbi:MAG: hypothetical protein HYV34_03395 [Candidatus Kerfeldbacteria bacterium]|nr:hypothetical protein [Candidatus Kerfeldbacteria bacterium]